MTIEHPMAHIAHMFKFEIQNNFEARMTEIQNRRRDVHHRIGGGGGREPFSVVR